MLKNSTSPTQYLLLLLTALVPRLLGAIWLPNAFGDAYCYVEQIYYMRHAMLSGSFGTANLFGFWLPLYQFVCALISTLVGTPFYVAKFVSAASGAGVCLLVFLLALELTANRRLALLAFGLIAFNPEHLLYSSSAMTDVPHAFVVLLCAYCCIRNRWLLASCLALLAGLMRIDGWLLIGLIPLVQLGRERKVSPVAVAVLLLSPLLWLYISWKAAGNPWAYFVVRNEYILQSLKATPSLAQLTLRRVGIDLARLLYGANPITLLIGLGLVLAIKQRRLKSLSRWEISASTVVCGFFLAHLLFLLTAYFSGNQPDIWPRYGLILFALGLPLVSKIIIQAGADKALWQRTDEGRRVIIRRRRRMLQLAGAVLSLHFCLQVIEVIRLTSRTEAIQIAAQFLHEQYAADKSIRVYCDDGAVRVLSGIPLEEFVDQYHSPHDQSAFLEALREKHVRYLVHTNMPGSQIGAFVSEIDSAPGSIALERVLPKPDQKLSEGMRIYRVDDLEIMARQKSGTRKQHASRYN